MIAHQQPATRREILTAGLTHELARLYVAARESGQYESLTGLTDNSLTEQLARALYVAQRQGAPTIPILQPPARLAHLALPHPDHKAVTVLCLGVEVTTASRAALAILQILETRYPNRVHRSAICKATDLEAWTIRDRIDYLRVILRAGGQLDIPKQQQGYGGWRLVKTGDAS